MFKFLSKVAKGTKGAIVASLDGAADVASVTVSAVKNITVNTFKEAGEFVREVIW